MDGQMDGRMMDGRMMDGRNMELMAVYEMYGLLRSRTGGARFPCINVGIVWPSQGIQHIQKMHFT